MTTAPTAPASKIAPRTLSGNGSSMYGSTIAGPVVAERVLALLRRIDAHVVGQQRHGDEEVGRRQQRLDDRSGRMSVTLQLHLFEVQRLVTQGRGLPGVRDQRPMPRFEDDCRADRAIARESVALLAIIQ